MASADGVWVDCWFVSALPVSTVFFVLPLQVIMGKMTKAKNNTLFIIVLKINGLYFIPST
jgi:hypothetical protein